MTAALVAGHRLGDYLLVQPVGRGSFGQVWLAEDRHGARIALKILRPADGTNLDSFRSWFHREYRTGRRVDSRFIATPFDADLLGEPPWIAFPYIEGRTLRQLIDREALSHDRVSDIALQILRGLTDLHAAGLVHRDIKPDNIMVSPGDRVTVLDLGIVHDPTATKVTLLGQPGTPAYLAPEAVQGRTADAGMDIWAFAVTVSDMLGPERRQSGAGPVETATGHPGWSDIVQACLSVEPHRRPSAPAIVAWIHDGCRAFDEIVRGAHDAQDPQEALRLLGLAAGAGGSEAGRSQAMPSPAMRHEEPGHLGASPARPADAEAVPALGRRGAHDRRRPSSLAVGGILVGVALVAGVLLGGGTWRPVLAAGSSPHASVQPSAGAQPTDTASPSSPATTATSPTAEPWDASSAETGSELVEDPPHPTETVTVTAQPDPPEPEWEDEAMPAKPDSWPAFEYTGPLGYNICVADFPLPGEVLRVGDGSAGASDAYSLTIAGAQAGLRSLNYGKPDPVVATGFLDAQTEAALRSFQTRKGIVADGTLGEQTWSELHYWVTHYQDNCP